MHYPDASGAFSSCDLSPHLQLKLTPEYLEMLRYQALTTNTKLYFGPDIPKLFMKETTDAAMPTVAAATNEQEGQ